MKTGIVLLNFGGPWTLKDVKPFLYRLFSDPAILVGIPTPIRQFVAFAISQAKGGASIENYALIGGGSPQLKWTEAQAAGLRALLDPESMRLEIAMRSAEPSIPIALARLKEWGAEKVVLLPLFPQFSTTTTGTCLIAVEQALAKLRWKPELLTIRNWPDYPGYISMLKGYVAETIEKAENELKHGPAGVGVVDGVESGGRDVSSEPVHVLFSAHSLPLKVVKRGDPYEEDVQRTVKALTDGLKNPWTLCFQSRNGKMPWLEPYTEEVIERLGREGVKRLVVTPISFVSDHIETLWELDYFYADLARKSGITHYYRVRTFNDDPGFPQVLRALLTENSI